MLPGIKTRLVGSAAAVKTPPTLVNFDIGNSGSGSSGTHSVTIPGSLVIGNKLVAAIACRGGSGSFTWPADFTERNDSDELSIAERVIDGTEAYYPSGGTISVTGPAARDAHFCLQIGNAASSAGNVAATTATGSTANADPNSVSTTHGTDPLLAITYLRVNAASDVTAAPSGYSNFNTSRAINDPSISFATKTIDPGANEDPGAWTSPAGDFAAQTILICGQ